MKKIFISTALIVLIVALLFPVTLLSREVKWKIKSTVTWTIKGNFNLYYQLPELQYALAKGSPYPLKGIQVRVSAAEQGIGKWNTWPDVTTASDGSFKVTNEKDQTKRKFRVEFRFHSDELEIRHENSTEELFSKDAKWYTAYETDDFFDAGTINLGTFIFRENAKLDVGAFEPRRHAEIWIVAKAAIDYFKTFGSAYEYKSTNYHSKQIKIKYPHDDTKAFGDVTASYSNPLNGVIYLYRNSSGSNDHFDVATIYHEMMHIWAYEHNSWPNGGEIDLMFAIVSQKYGHDSHGFTNNKVAFHEGFAEYASDELCLALFPKSNSVSTASSSTTYVTGIHYHEARLPYNRDRLNEGVASPGDDGSSKITSIDKMQTHDAGWWSYLHILTTLGLEAKTFSRSIISTSTSYAKVFNTQTFGCTNCFIGTQYGANQTGSCTLTKQISFKDVLKVFNSNSSAGYSTALGTDDMKLDKFIQRAKAILGLSTKDADTYIRLADPSGNLQPYDALCK